MIMTVTTIEVVPGHQGALEDLQRLLREAKRQYAALHRVSLLRDSAHPTHYLILSEWAGHEELAAAMRAGLLWLLREWTTDWTRGSPRVYDEIVEIGETTESEGGSR